MITVTKESENSYNVYVIGKTRQELKKLSLECNELSRYTLETIITDGIRDRLESL